MKLIKKLLLITLSLFLLCQPVLANNTGCDTSSDDDCSIRPVPRIGKGEVIVGRDVFRLLYQTKEFDISDSDINITITDADKSKLESDAKVEAFEWIKNTRNYLLNYVYDVQLFNDSLDSSNSYDEFISKLEEGTDQNKDLINSIVHLVDEIKDEYSKLVDYFCDNSEVLIRSFWESDPVAARDVFGTNNVDSCLQWSNYAVEYHEMYSPVLSALITWNTNNIDLTAYPELEEFNRMFTEDYIVKVNAAKDAVAAVDDDFLARQNMLRMFKGKFTELYTQLFSDFLVAQLQEKFPVIVNFSAIGLADDGSEDDKYGIGGEIKRGILEGDEQLIQKMDFGSTKQFYDKVLIDGLNSYGNNVIDKESYLFDLFKSYANQNVAYVIWDNVVTVNDPANAYLADGRDFVDHIMFIDYGFLRSSDDSQNSCGLPKEDGDYPGWHCLLDICDSLHTYSWARHGIPGGFYTQTFNLHFNPAVTYIVKDIKRDLITNVEFDGDRLVKIEKPIMLSEDIKEALTKNNRNDGVYRFKLVEDVEATELNDELVLDDREFFLDINISTDWNGNPIITQYNIGSLNQINYDNDTTPVTKVANKYIKIKEELSVKPIVISKVDINSEELAGAVLQVSDTADNVIDKWTSETNPHLLDLEPGIYTLKEISAPVGYKRLETTIKFKVTDDYIVELLTTNSLIESKNNIISITNPKEDEHETQKEPEMPKEDEPETPKEEPKQEVYKPQVPNTGAK